MSYIIYKVFSIRKKIFTKYHSNDVGTIQAIGTGDLF